MFLVFYVAAGYSVLFGKWKAVTIIEQCGYKRNESMNNKKLFGCAQIFLLLWQINARWPCM